MDKVSLLLRVCEAAQALGLSRSKVYALIAAGRLPSVHMGRAVRVPRRALEELIERLAQNVGDQVDLGRE